MGSWTFSILPSFVAIMSLLMLLQFVPWSGLCWVPFSQTRASMILATFALNT